MNYLDLIIEPDNDEPSAAMILVEGQVGVYQDRFLLDTGAARSCVALNEHTAAFESVDKSNSSGVLAAIQDDIIIAPTFVVGPIARANFTMARAEPSSPGPKNLIGMDLLKDFRCEFRLDEGKLYLDREDSSSGLIQFNDLIMDEVSHPYVEVAVDSGIAKGVWDSGASLTVVDSNFVQRNPGFFSQAGTSTGTDASGSSVETPMLTMREVQIGGRLFPECRVASVDLSQVNRTLKIPMDMIIGYNIISKASWLFDFPRRRWAFLNA